MSSYVPVDDLESPHIKDIAEWAVAEYNKQGHQLTLSRVVKCESQIVSGVNYRFILMAKDENDNEGNYEAVVWEKAWENFRELISFQLLLSSSLRDDYVPEDPKIPQVVDGYVPVDDPESPHLKELAEWAVAEYNKQGHQLTLKSVLKCESQIVEGVNYRFVLLAKDENYNEENYEAVVWEKAWEYFRVLISFRLLLT